MGDACCRRTNITTESEFFSVPCKIERKKYYLDPNLNMKLITEYKSYVVAIIKIQSWYRGCCSRKIYKIDPLNSMMIIKYISNRIKSNEPAVHKIEMKEGPYMVSWNLQEAKEAGLKLRKPTMEDAQGIYCGYWDITTNKKQGYGQELFPNGAKYEGFWNNGEFNGKGRFIYENGDYFFGDWKNGNTEGMGSFISIEGSTYYGGWENNLHQGYGT